MQKHNLHTAIEKKVNSNYFTGRVNIREILAEENSGEQEMYYVTFHNGALTTLHFHESDQILIATNGKGVIGLMKGGNVLRAEVDMDSITFINEWDTVCIPANITHFHGALGGENLSHIAIMKRYTTDTDEKGGLKRSATKWEYDLLQEENPNGGESLEKFINAAQDEIRNRIQLAISKKRQVETR
jgi:quercetin dioxygenase-like cupin family protein